MANMTFSGTQELMDQLFAESERLERKATEMLGEAGKVVVKAWQDVIEERGHVETGDMRDSVRADRPTRKGEVYTCTIKPHGRDRKKQYNNDKAYVLHYGTSRIKGDRFIDEAEARASEAAEQVMQDVWDKD